MSCGEGFRRASRLTRGLHTLLLAIVGVACSDSAAPNPRVTLDLQGVVTDATSGSPIAGASVEAVKCKEPLPLEQCTRLSLARTTTAQDGRYHLIYSYTFLCDTPPHKAPFWAEASASGYQTQSAGDLFDTPLLCTPADQSLDFALPPQPASHAPVR